MPTKIQGAEYPIKKIFCNDFVFSLPLYQRPYAWTTEQAGELLEDLIGFLGDGDEPIEEINPYFLGSIVLIKPENKPDAEIVDGQQRLTTLTILLAALRASVPAKFANALTKFLYEEGDPITNTPNRYRLTLRERDADFFQKYIQDEGWLTNLQSLNVASISDSQRNIRDNALLFLERLRELPEEQRIRLTQFIVNSCLLVVVSTPDLESAYRIFSVLNDRGLDLSHTDILKAEVIGKISSDQQEKFANKWEDIEEFLGRDTFQELFGHIRMIYRKAKPREGILKEFRLHVKPNENPTQFIETILCPLSEAFQQIKSESYQSTHQAEAINQLFKYLNRVDNSDWLPSAILYLSKYYHQPEQLFHFFTDLDRLASGLMLRRANINERIERYGRLLSAIENGDDLYAKNSPLQLTRGECDSILECLNGDLYLIQKIRLYVLMRLDAALSEGDASYNFRTIGVEHVLPQNPSANSQWKQWFPTQDKHDFYVHRIGNLVLLSHAKNGQAQNYEFEVKKQKYFKGRNGVSPFALTTQVLNEKKWTPEVVERRQRELIGKLKQLWRL